MNDQDSKVRYFGCEAMYNICKVEGPLALQFFNEIFDSLCKLSADPEKSVKDGAQLLDRLIKDIVCEADSFDVERFIPLLEQRIIHAHPFVRQFLIGWITTLESVPTVELLQHLPKILDGLFFMLGEKNKEISMEVGNCLNIFLNEIKDKKEEVDFATMTNILVFHCNTLSNPEQLTHYVALGWLNEFIGYGKEKMLPLIPELLSSVIPSLSFSVSDIKSAALLTNTSLLNLFEHTTSPERIPLEKMICLLFSVYLFFYTQTFFF